MEISNLQKQAFENLKKINRKLNIKHDPYSMFLHLAEEVGEVARELQKKQKNWRENFDKEKLAEELADVFFDILIVAEDNNIDLLQSFNKKMEKIKERYKLD